MPLFHFTDIQSVYSILTNKSIWLTDLRFLNDKRELLDGVEIFSKVLKDPQHGLFTHDNFREQSTEYLRKAFSDSCSFGIDEEPIFVFSLSKIGTLLSQWKSYGSYAIEFDEKILKSEIKNVVDCIYSEKNKYQTAKSLVTESLAKISHDMADSRGCVGLSSFDSLVKIMEFAAMFKDEGFDEEQEVRIVAKAKVGEDSIKFKQKNNKLIPYIVENISLDCIRAIHVGPMGDQKLAFKSMSAFVRNIEKNWQIDSGNIKYELNVTESPIPYRGNK